MFAMMYVVQMLFRPYLTCSTTNVCNVYERTGTINNKFKQVLTHEWNSVPTWISLSFTCMTAYSSLLVSVCMSAIMSHKTWNKLMMGQFTQNFILVMSEKTTKQPKPAIVPFIFWEVMQYANLWFFHGKVCGNKQIGRWALLTQIKHVLTQAMLLSKIFLAHGEKHPTPRRHVIA